MSRSKNESYIAGELAKKRKERRNSDGNLVNVGNFDADGVNVNRNRPDNHNDNLGVSFSRSLGRKRIVTTKAILFCF